jgi:hypothetical protein
VRVLALAELWHQARLAGPLADSRREYISRCLLERLYTALCGSRWAHAEEAFLRNPQIQCSQQLERAIEVEARNNFPAALRQNHTKLTQSTAAGAKWFAEAAQRYDVCADPKLCMFALRLASWPFGLGVVYGEDAATMLASIPDNPVLMRGARMLALLSIAADPDHPNASLPRWVW